MSTLAPPSTTPAKTSWADDVEEEESLDLNQRTETIDSKTGIKTIVEYKSNDKGQKVKVTRQIRLTLSRSLVSSAVASRKSLPKFGKERGKPSGPHSATTTVGENIKITLRPPGLAKQEEKAEEDRKKAEASMNIRQITCRICKGNHYTPRCPHQETLGSLLNEDFSDDLGVGPDTPKENTPLEKGKNDVYVPIFKRGGGARPSDPGMGSSMRRDDLPTLRVTNLSEDTREEDVWTLFERFGRVSRVYVGMDNDLHICKGFAFVTFEKREDADKARKKIDGMPYDHLILGCQFSTPRGEKPDK